MAFSFGQPAAATSSSNLFGGASNSGNTTGAAAKPLFGGFTTPNPQQQNIGGNMFGAQNAAPAAPSTFNFGSSTAGNNAAQGAGAATGGGLFGNQQQGQQQSGGGLFGNAPKPSGGLFGSTTQPTQQSSGLFGSTSQPQQQSGGLFGSTSQPQQQQSGGLFGSTLPQTQQQQSGGLFGSTSQPQQQSGGLFGASQPTHSNSLFGGQPQNSLFGSTSQQQQQPLFGSQINQQSQQGGLFGSLANSQQPSSLFASTSGSQPVLGASMAPAQKAEVGIEERMMAVQRAWDTSSPDCRFKYFFYNVVDPAQLQQYGRPAGATDETRWIKALREIPDPTCMVPVLATGWADVRKRIQMQEQVASVHQQKAKEISQALDKLSRQNTLATSIRLAALQTSLAQLQHRLIRLAALSPAFIPSLQSSALRPDEVETKRILEDVKTEMDGKKVVKASGGPIGLANTPKRGAAGGMKMMGQVNELWGLVEELRRRGRRVGERDSWLSDERALAEVAEILQSQQIALQKLSEVSTNAVFDADVMRRGISGER